MKIKSGFVLHKVGGEHVVVPVGKRTKEFSGMIRLNDTGAFLWQHMEGTFTADSLTASLLSHYDVPEETAATTVARFIENMRRANLLED